MRDFSDQIETRDPDRDVAITSIDACVVEGNFEWNLIKVETDAGVTGIGESYRGGGIPELVEYTNRFLVGENPLDVERLVRYIFQEMSGHGGTTGKVVTAASGIEVALLDAAGKILGLPVYQLLGSKYRDEVRLYCDCHAGEAYAVEDGATDYAQFSTEMLSQLVTDYVEPGTIALEFRNLAYIGGDPFLGPDAPAAGQAGLAVWNTDPASYWTFHEYVFRNQPPESDQWATAERLVEFAQAAGVSETASIRTAIQENQYDDALRATDRAASDTGVDATPTLLIDGTTVNPLGNEERTRQLIEDAAGSN